MTPSQAPGRNCPLHYCYRPSDFAVPASTCCEVLYVVGGLYGNVQALNRVVELFERECGDKRLVFNGDFHWFDVDAQAFAQIQRGVLVVRGDPGQRRNRARHAASHDDDDVGCGCGYPDWVGDAVVERSNQILKRLRGTARAMPGACRELATLPMWRRIDVGDAESPSCTATRSRCRAGASRKRLCTTARSSRPLRSGSRRRRSTSSPAATPACRCSRASQMPNARAQRSRRWCSTTVPPACRTWPLPAKAC